MCRLLIVASNNLERRFIAGIASAECDAVLEAADLKAAAKALRSKDTCPTMIAAVLKPGREDTLKLLQSLHDSRSSIPVLLFVVTLKTMPISILPGARQNFIRYLAAQRKTVKIMVVVMAVLFYAVIFPRC